VLLYAKDQLAAKGGVNRVLNGHLGILFLTGVEKNQVSQIKYGRLQGFSDKIFLFKNRLLTATYCVAAN
jgi:hypothetical protein